MRSVVVFLGLLAAAPVGAMDGARSAQVPVPGHDDPNCYCLAQGRSYGPGERICLRTAEGPRLAQCQMETNVMSWTITSIPCPET